jgi:hypothetical protein
MCRHPESERVYNPANRVWVCGACGDSSLAPPQKDRKESDRVQ